MSILPRLRAAALALLLPTPALAQLVAPGDCALVVASRPDLGQSFAYLRETGLDARDIYLSANGWYAISLGTLRADSAAERIEGMKRAGTIPSDSFCSSGRGFTALAWSAAASTEAPRLDGPFDARPLSWEDKIFLQSGLALSGDYDGLIDGEWGAGSQRAYERFLGRMDWPDTNRSAAGLAMVTGLAMDEDGWTDFYMPNLNAGLYYPRGSMTLGTNQRTSTNTIHSDDGLISVEFLLGSHGDTVDFHLAIRGSAGNYGPLYSAVSDAQIVSGTKNAGLYFYARSLRDPADGLWSTVLVTNDLSEGSRRPALIAASFRIGRPVPLRVPRGGALDGLMLAFSEEVEDRPSPQETAPVSRDGGPARFSASGSGFYVDAKATVMTNAHVVEGCDRLTIDGEAFRVKAASEGFDLALLVPDRPRGADHHLRFAATPARLNSDVTVAGFPLNTTLKGLNITRGSISSVEGAGDPTRMQITAPVQPGNSGGPIVDRFGRVVGIVVAKLDEGYTLERAGVLPENVNFGVRAGIGTLFAGSHGVAVSRSEAREEIAPEDLADLLREATVLIACEGSR